MVDVWLIIIACVVPFVLTAINVIIMAKFIHPNDISAWVPKIVVLLGLLFAEGSVLLLPLDVGNRSGAVGCGFWNPECGGLDMAVVWQIVYCAVAGMVVVVIPYTIFYYEADSGDEKELLSGNKKKVSTKWRHCTALKYLIGTLIVSLGLLFATFFFLRTTHIPVKVFTLNTAYSSVQQFVPVTNQLEKDTTFCGAFVCDAADGVIEMEVTFVVYLATLMSFVGWFFFVLYAGIGVVGLPMDLLNGFLHRRKLLKASVAARYKKTLQDQAAELQKMGTKLREELEQQESQSHGWLARRQLKSRQETQLNLFRQLVDQLNQDYEDLEMSSPANWKHYNRAWPYISLFLFIFAVIISLLWLTHIVLYMLIDPPVSRFLNEYLIWFDGWFPLFGTLTIAVFSLYLLGAVVVGSFKMGLRFFLNVHPMKLHGTYMNSFLFNVGLVLLCCLPTVQFCTEAFADYARLTDTDVIFGSQVRNMQFFRYFFQSNAFIFALLGITFLALIFFVMCPNEKNRLAKEQVKLREKLDRQHELELKQIARRNA